MTDEPKRDVARERMLDALGDRLRREHPEAIVEVVDDRCPHCGGTGRKRRGTLECLTCHGTGKRPK